VYSYIAVCILAVIAVFRDELLSCHHSADVCRCFAVLVKSSLQLADHSTAKNSPDYDAFYDQEPSHNYQVFRTYRSNPPTKRKPIHKKKSSTFSATTIRWHRAFFNNSGSWFPFEYWSFHRDHERERGRSQSHQQRHHTVGLEIRPPSESMLLSAIVLFLSCLPYWEN